MHTQPDRRVEIAGSPLSFRFRGKSGKRREVSLRDSRLAAIVRRCRDIPGYELFQYIDDDGQRRIIDSADVNECLRAVSGRDFTAKDFRTWAGTVRCAAVLRGLPRPATVAQRPETGTVARFVSWRPPRGFTAERGSTPLQTKIDQVLTIAGCGSASLWSSGAGGGTRAGIAPRHGIGASPDDRAEQTWLPRG